MGFFGCFSSHKKKASKKTRGQPLVPQPHKEHPRPQHMARSFSQAPSDNHRRITPEARHNCPNNSEGGNNNIAAETFTFRELASATKNFRQECLLGEGGFGRVYKGCLDKTGQIVAVKQLDRNGLQGNKEFLVEVLMLSLLHNQNLVNLIGYCADGEQRLLVYEFMALGSLEDHLLELPPGHPPLPWFIRMKIALNAARGLEYLHDKANPPVIYRDLKSSNILLDKEYNAKLSDFGLAKLGPVGDNSHVSSRVMGTYGYCAPEYQKTGQLTVKSDVYSFGVVLLEIITGKRVIDTTRRSEEQNLVTWAEPIFKEPNRFSELVDPLLRGDYPKKNFNQAVAVAAMCLQEDAHIRPSMSDVVTALSFLGVEPDLPISCRSLQRSESSRSHQSGISAVERLKIHQSEISALERRKRNQSEISAIEREKAVAEAKEWGSRSRRSIICT